MSRTRYALAPVGAVRPCTPRHVRSYLSDRACSQARAPRPASSVAPRPLARPAARPYPYPYPRPPPGARRETRPSRLRIGIVIRKRDADLRSGWAYSHADGARRVPDLSVSEPIAGEWRRRRCPEGGQKQRAERARPDRRGRRGVYGLETPGIDASNIVHLPDYRVWTSVSIGDGERSDALQLRTDKERERVEQRVLQEHGVEPPTPRTRVSPRSRSRSAARRSRSHRSPAAISLSLCDGPAADGPADRGDRLNEIFHVGRRHIPILLVPVEPREVVPIPVIAV